ncbi:MAG TPA: nucleoside deaminase [Acidimicrobiales bacterium]|nr:nucleoside deaminase [Acidimicrobiales bacterium]
MAVLRIEGPDWLDDLPRPALGPGAADEDRMAWVLDVLDRQVAERTGGPFAAAVFGGPDGAVLGVGVNRVEPTATCVAHAEVLALAEATQRVGRYSLAGTGSVLVTSTEPCAMCLGALVWGGVDRVVCAAADADARAVGFDEGDKPADWVAALGRRGIEVVHDVHRDRAVAAMRRYVEQGGTVYNG